MFQLLQTLVAGSSLSLSLTGNKDDTITVIVAPKGDGPLAQPLVLTATAVELDAEFHSVVSSYVAARKGLAEQVEATAAVIEAAKKASAAQAVAAITKKSSSSGTTTTAATPESSDLDDDDEDADSSGSKAAPATPAASADALVDNLFA